MNQERSGEIIGRNYDMENGMQACSGSGRKDDPVESGNQQDMGENERRKKKIRCTENIVGKRKNRNENTRVRRIAMTF